MISLRKINVILVIIIIMVLAYHALMNVFGMYGMVAYSPDFKVTGRRLFYPFVCHVIISLYLSIKDKSRKFNIYPKLTRDTTQQLLSGIFMIIFATLHILVKMYLPGLSTDATVNLIHFAVDILLFISIAVHLNVSIPKLFVSLGFLDGDDSYRKMQSKTKIAISIIMILFIIGEIIFYIGGII